MDYFKAIEILIGRKPIIDVEVSLIDHSDGNGVQIEFWNISGHSQPSIKELIDLYNANLDKIKSEELRDKRLSEFLLFDKYQLICYWSTLTETQKQEFQSWRFDWLNAPHTLIEPKRPDWFKE